MEIVKKNNYTFRFDSRWSEIILFGNNRCLSEIKNDLEIIRNYIANGLKVNNNEFCKLIHRFYDVKFSRDDLLKILSNINKIEYDRFVYLNTRDIFKDLVSEGQGRDFSFWEDYFQKNIYVACAKDLKIDDYYLYSNSEINEMINRKLIVPFKVIKSNIGYNPKINTESEKVAIDSDKMVTIFDDKYDSFVYNFDELLEINTLYDDLIYKKLISLLRRRLDKKRLLRDFKEVLLFLNHNIRLADAIEMNDKEIINQINDERKKIAVYRINYC